MMTPKPKTHRWQSNYVSNEELDRIFQDALARARADREAGDLDDSDDEDDLPEFDDTFDEDRGTIAILTPNRNEAPKDVLPGATATEDRKKRRQAGRTITATSRRRHR